MSSDEKCCWPHCRNERDCMYLGKPLCDKHCDMVQAENEGAANKARKKIGLLPFSTVPLMEKIEEDPSEIEIEERLSAGYFDLDE